MVQEILGKSLNAERQSERGLRWAKFSYQKTGGWCWEHCLADGAESIVLVDGDETVVLADGDESVVVLEEKCGQAKNRDFISHKLASIDRWIWKPGWGREAQEDKQKPGEPDGGRNIYKLIPWPRPET